MKVLIDICHPAHVHFFKNIILILEKNNHEVLITSRDKDVTIDLLDKLAVKHLCISKAPTSKSLIGFARELIKRDFQLIKIARRFKPDIMVAIGGIFVAHAGLFVKSRTIACYDTENAKLQNLLTYPFINKLLVPRAYKSWTPRNRTTRYNGYHELSYLHPGYFTPNKEIALKNGLQPKAKNFLLRIVSWNANHDINEAGWTNDFLKEIVSELSSLGKVIISTERTLPKELDKHVYRGEPDELHHLLAFCSLYIGESATIASEAAVLGVPAIYIANTSRGYIDEQEEMYQLVRVIKDFNASEIRKSIYRFLKTDSQTIRQRHNQLRKSTLDVAHFVYEQICDQFKK